MRESGEALLTIVNDILDISKLEAGKFELENIDFDLVNTVESAIGADGRQGAREEHRSRRRSSSPRRAASIAAIRHALRQILLNLICNAIKFTDKGGVWSRSKLTQVEDPATGRRPICASK